MEFSLLTNDFLYNILYIFRFWFIYSQNVSKHIYIFTQPLRTSWMWLKVNIQAEFNWFESRDFLLLDLLPIKKQKIPVCFAILPNSGRRRVEIPNFLNGISKTNAKILVQDLNSGCWVHLQRWYLLRREYLHINPCTHTITHIYIRWHMHI